MYDYRRPGQPQQLRHVDLGAPLNTWTHVTAVYDAPTKQLRLYVNGIFRPPRRSAASTCRGPPPAR